MVLEQALELAGLWCTGYRRLIILSIVPLQSTGVRERK